MANPVIIQSAADMRAYTANLRRAGKTIGLVPTMGFLHAGHISLVELARQSSDKVVLTIFVNPTQFGPNEDFERYPRDFERDCRLCADAGVDAIFHPLPDTMYNADHSVQVVENSLARGLCGASRPGHFTGVLTIVAKLFNIVTPDIAVFGQKDAQQERLIRRMTRDLDFPIRLIAAPIIREEDGLAMSSRNKYLSATERSDALCLMRALQLVHRMYREGGRDAEAMKKNMTELIRETPSADIDYIEIVDDENLQSVTVIQGDVLVALAVRFGKTRLIDNLMLPDDRLNNLPPE